MSVGPDVFGEDYLHFYGPRLEEASDEQAGLIWRLLALGPGVEVLDLACGHGRIANRLAERGAHVTGLDADPLFLALARQDALARGVAVDYQRGDMRTLPWEARFDAVVLWFTAFGYFDDDGNAAVLRAIRRALREGGRLILDVNHLPYVLANLQRQGFVRRGDDVMLDEYTWHPATSTMGTRRTVLRDGRARELAYAVRMYMPAELGALLRSAGFARVDLLGAAGEPLTAMDRRLVAVAAV